MQFGLDEILTVIDKVNHAGLSSFEYQDTDTKIKIRTASKEISDQAAVPAVRPEIPPDTDGADEVTVLSPMVGTFYTAPSEGAKSFVQVGDVIKKGQIVGIVEAMKLMNEIESEYDGVVTGILVENEQMVEYGQPLLKVKVENA